VHAKLGQAVWESVSQEMEALFRQGKFEAGVISGIQKVGAQLAQHYPQSGLKRMNFPIKR